jgi:hypothetical protein
MRLVSKYLDMCRGVLNLSCSKRKCLLPNINNTFATEHIKATQNLSRISKAKAIVSSQANYKPKILLPQ